jgi:hypothetical protein
MYPWACDSGHPGEDLPAAAVVIAAVAAGTNFTGLPKSAPKETMSDSASPESVAQ